MPKRSNPFQQLIAKIEKDIAPQGVRVTESAELPEYSDDDSREIDVLVEGELNGFPIKIAIECRDHARDQDKTWIDSLIGKYKDLGVDKIVAVSSSGFSEGAIVKAQRNGIITKTLEEALETNWPEELERYIVKFLMEKHELVEYSFTYERNGRELTQQEFKSSKLVRLNSGISGDPEEFVRTLYESQIKPAVTMEIGKRRDELWVDDSRKKVNTKLSVSFDDLYIELAGGEQRKIHSVNFSVDTEINFSEARHKYYTYDNKAQVVVASLEDDHGKVKLIAYKLLGKAESKPQIASVNRTPKKPKNKKV